MYGLLLLVEACGAWREAGDDVVLAHGTAAAQLAVHAILGSEAAVRG